MDVREQDFPGWDCNNLITRYWNWDECRLWQDANHDGVSEPGELHALASLGVAWLHLGYKESKRTDEFGNRFRYRAKVDDAKATKANRRAWDVFPVSGQLAFEGWEM